MSHRWDCPDEYEARYQPALDAWQSELEDAA